MKNNDMLSSYYFTISYFSRILESTIPVMANVYNSSFEIGIDSTLLLLQVGHLMATLL